MVSDDGCFLAFCTYECREAWLGSTGAVLSDWDEAILERWNRDCVVCAYCAGVIKYQEQCMLHGRDCDLFAWYQGLQAATFAETWVAATGSPVMPAVWHQAMRIGMSKPHLEGYLLALDLVPDK